jgi:hypothetical protein
MCNVTQTLAGVKVVCMHQVCEQEKYHRGRNLHLGPAAPCGLQFAAGLSVSSHYLELLLPLAAALGAKQALGALQWLT